MDDFNEDLNDKRIRDLLKWRLLEQVEEDDLLTQKLTDMEAKIAFGGEALYVPSLQKEKELVEKLNENGKAKTFYKWLFPFVIALITLTVFLYFNSSKINPAVVGNPGNAPSLQQPGKPLESSTVVPVKDSAEASKAPFSFKKAPESTVVAIDTFQTQKEENWLVGDPGIKVDYHPSTVKYDPALLNAYDQIPTLNEKQMAENNKLKEKMIRQVIKKDKGTWSYIPMGTDVFYGDTVSMYAFYMSATEVTNKQYHVFLNDLIIKDKMDDYLEAIPDTTKWRIDGKAFFEPMVKMYFWHPAYDNYPVVNVSRKQAEMYCVWLTLEVNAKIKTDNADSKDLESMYVNDVRIPAETEWMMAARGGKLGAEFPWGTDGVQNAKGCFLCNFWVNQSTDKLDTLSACSHKDILPSGKISDGGFFTVPVTSYNPNAYGLYCMSGNVAEMVWSGNKNAATKGGSWRSDFQYVKISGRGEHDGFTEASPYIGFRPVFTAPKKK